VQEGEGRHALGRNGAGRTTTLRAIMGLAAARSGSVLIDGTETVRLRRIDRPLSCRLPESAASSRRCRPKENLLLPRG